MKTLNEYAYEWFGWMPPCCWECGQPMELVRLDQLENVLVSTDGRAEFRCYSNMPHKSRLFPFVVFEREVGIDRIREYGWTD